MNESQRESAWRTRKLHRWVPRLTTAANEELRDWFREETRLAEENGTPPPMTCRQVSEEEVWEMARERMKNGRVHLKNHHAFREMTDWLAAEALSL